METEESSHALENAGRPPTIPSVVSGKRIALVAAAFVVLVYGTVLVFQAFDRASHSASDTLRPFLITMAPVWTVAVAGAAAFLQGRRG